MVQLYLEGGLDAVLAIAARDDIDPATHSPTDYSAWRFHSKVAKIGYGDEKFTYTFPVADYSFDKTNRPDANIYYSPNASTPKTKALTFYNGGYWLETFAYGTNIFSAADRNGFHFVVPEASGWRSLWRMVKRDPPDSEDTYIMTGRPAFTTTEFGFLAPYKQGSAFSVYSVVESLGEMTLTPDHQLSRVIAPSLAGLGSQKYSCYKLDLPVDSTPMPSNGGTHVVGKEVLVIDPTTAKMAKPGYDVTAADQNLIFSSDRLPMKVVKTGEVTVGAGQTVNVALGGSYSSSILVDYVARKATANHFWVPPWPDETSSEINIEYRVSGSTLSFRNVGTVATDVRYFVMAADDLGNSTGSADTFEAVAGSHVIIRRPGSAGTRLRDTILDSRLSWMPIVAEGWVPFSSFVASNLTEIATHMHVVSFSNPGARFKPYVLAKLARSLKSDPTKVVFREPFAKRMEFSNYFSDSTFMYRAFDTSVTFYASNGGRFEDAWNTSKGIRSRTSSYNTLGLRYYIFALPTSL